MYFLEILKEMYCLFTHEVKWPRHGVVNLPFVLLTLNVMKSHMHGKKLEKWFYICPSLEL